MKAMVFPADQVDFLIFFCSANGNLFTKMIAYSLKLERIFSERR